MSSNHWSSRLAFIITASAFAVGLGNIWRFPYIVGEGGGGAFLLVYLALILLIGIPLLTVEMALGRLSEATPLVGFGKLSKSPAWNGIGWLAVIATLMIMSYYVMILAWILSYFVECISGNLMRLEPAELPGHFSAVTHSLGTAIGMVAGILLLSFLIVTRGLQSGLERYSRFMMAGLALMLLALAAWAATLEGAVAGYRWYLTPDFSKVNARVAISALGQMCFSVGVGMGIAFVFGSYSDKEDNLPGTAGWIVLADTAIALIAGLMIFPAIFTFGLSPDSGPSLVFISMASIFGQIAYGRLLGAAFFLLLFLAGFTSLIASVQGLKDSFQEKFGLSSASALWLVTGIIGVGSVPVIFSYADQPWMIFGKTVFDFLDYLANNILLPVGASLLALFSAYVVGYARLAAHIDQGAGRLKIGNKWKLILKVIIPLALLIILWNGIF